MNFRTLRPEEIDIRVARATENGAQFLLYKDARVDMDILDETVKPANWQRRHDEHHGNLFCAVGIKEDGEWVWKEDAGSESNTEAEKGHASDSFKRACVNWGIGRELYTSPFIWVKGCTEESRGKYIPKREYASLKVVSIEYDEERRITALAIAKKDGEAVYTFGKASAPKAPETPAQAAQQPQEAQEKPKATVGPGFICENCGKQIFAYKDANGGTVGVRKHCEGSKNKFGKVLCLDCIQNGEGLKE